MNTFRRNLIIATAAISVLTVAPTFAMNNGSSDYGEVTSLVQSGYTFTDDDSYMYATANVNIRDLPSVDGNIVRTASVGEQLHVTGICNETGWSTVDGGYVSSNYLSDSDPLEMTSDETYYDDGLVGQLFSGESGDSKVRYTWYTSGSSQADINAGAMISYIYSFYYAADIKTTYGQQIASLNVGDIVSIDGSLVQIDGELHANYNTDTVDGIVSIVGARPMFQTCEPPYGGPVVIKYGHYL